MASSAFPTRWLPGQEGRRVLNSSCLDFFFVLNGVFVSKDASMHAISTSLSCLIDILVLVFFTSFSTV